MESYGNILESSSESIVLQCPAVLQPVFQLFMSGQDGASHEDQLQLIQLSVADLVLLNKAWSVAGEEGRDEERWISDAVPKSHTACCICRELQGLPGKYLSSGGQYTNRCNVFS